MDSNLCNDALAQVAATLAAAPLPQADTSRCVMWRRGAARDGVVGRRDPRRNAGHSLIPEPDPSPWRATAANDGQVPGPVDW
jgi:hypothetical protein